MKPAEARRLAIEHTLSELQEAAEHLGQERPTHLGIEGKDEGEKFTHVLLAIRIRERIDKGDDPKEAFRAVMGEVRGVLSND